MIDGGLPLLTGHHDSSSCSGLDGESCCQCGEGTTTHGLVSDDLSWLSDVKVGYDGGFVIASKRELDLKTSSFPFRLQFNGWGQLRYTASDVAPPNQNLNQFQLKRARIVFSGSRVQSRLLVLRPAGWSQQQRRQHAVVGLLPQLRFRPRSIRIGQEERLAFGPESTKCRSRWLAGCRESSSSSPIARSPAPIFDVNRSLAWGLYGKTDRLRVPIEWETAIFNGFVTGGAETGSSGDLDDNFAYSVRLSCVPAWRAGVNGD